MADVAVGELLRLAVDALTGQGFPPEAAEPIAQEFVAAELAGTKTHGLGKLVSLNFGDLSAAPAIADAGPLMIVDGMGGSGFLLMQEVVRRAADLCDTHGVALAFARNFSRYSSLYPYTETLARRGLIGVLMNSAGPPAVVPYGSIDPITGTNPLCFSFPTEQGPQTFDFATSELVWGEIRQAALEDRRLKPNAFLDADGRATETPADVNAVRAFGGAKGFALNLAIELLCGPAAGASAGLAVDNEFELGALLLAIDPSRTSGGGGFPAAASRLLNEIRASRPEDAARPVRCPGDSRRSEALDVKDTDARLSVPDKTVDLLKRLGRGEDVSELSSDPLYN